MSARASGRRCAPWDAGLIISSRTNRSAAAAASHAALPMNRDPSPPHSHRAAVERRARRSSQSLVSASLSIRALLAAVMWPAATSVARVTSEPPSRRSLACRGLRLAPERNFWTFPMGGEATASERTRLAKSSPCARGRAASAGSASIASRRQSATSPHVMRSPSANEGSQRRRRDNSLVTSSGNNRRTRVDTSSGIAALVTSLGGVTSSSKCACWCTRHVSTCDTCPSAAEGAMPKRQCPRPKFADVSSNNRRSRETVVQHLSRRHSLRTQSVLMWRDVRDPKRSFGDPAVVPVSPPVRERRLRVLRRRVAFEVRAMRVDRHKLRGGASTPRVRPRPPRPPGGDPTAKASTQKKKIT